MKLKGVWVLSLASALIVAWFARQYPMLDMVAGKVVQKYQGMTCEQLWQQKSQPKSADEQRVIGLLKSDPQMRTAFVNQVAARIVQQDVRVRDEVPDVMGPADSETRPLEIGMPFTNGFERAVVSAAVTVSLGVAMVLSGSAQAGGVLGYELGTADLGLASAGYGARAQDASTVFTNPAGMTRLTETNSWARGSCCGVTPNSRSVPAPCLDSAPTTAVTP